MTDAFLEPSQLNYLNVVEAASLWRLVTEEEVTPDAYREKCASGDLAGHGVSLRHDGDVWLTDMDSLLEFFQKQEQSEEQMRRLEEVLEERRIELEGW
ncbi:MAG: hypothetical protein R2826_10640 [Thermoleophilia bacterium]